MKVVLLLSCSLLLLSCKQDFDENRTVEVLSDSISDTTTILTQPVNQVVPNVENIPLIEDQKNYTVTPVVEGLNIPWGMDWLPNGHMIYTEKEGKMFLYDGKKSTEIQNVPDVYVRGQGGLLDVIVHPDFFANNTIFFSYASSMGTGDGGNTAIASAVLDKNNLTNIKVLYKAEPNTKKGQHFGSRFAWGTDKKLYFSIGERGERDVNPQDITRDGGKIYRINDDGTIPEDNPFVGIKDAKTAAYTYGNRNPQGLLRHPVTGQIIAHEHGPQGGDEINIIKAGVNYGWPVISYGINYDGTDFTDITNKEGMAQPIYYWVPSIAPSGFAVIDNDSYADWNGNFLVGSLKFQYLEMLYMDGNQVTKREKLVDGIGRLRNVKMGPDGHIYVGVEGKGIYKISK
ncbi:PQQ-dependent sugar dehydrogenase [Nonlabens marinus]|uniref:PQQ-dependent oxidoreductase, gdhB family n=1 Tax=Nonlabens marinus S1-08 TaxID=1454201 RepID=W8VS72_9FLAO|nr:PQQ-dependent sugar dehydrogenase [Nonlabens marinus]BAO56689.1 PQQ-dependent oxidoreductase, gdhB family [Nonlabens marinus S1-08]